MLELKIPDLLKQYPTFYDLRLAVISSRPDLIGMRLDVSDVVLFVYDYLSNGVEVEEQFEELATWTAMCRGIELYIYDCLLEAYNEDIQLLWEAELGCRPVMLPV